MPQSENAHWVAHYRCRFCHHLELRPCLAFGTLHEVLDAMEPRTVHKCTLGRIGIMVLEGVVRTSPDPSEESDEVELC